MGKILFFLILPTIGLAQAPETFNYVMYGEYEVAEHQITKEYKMYDYKSIIAFYGTTIDVFTFNWSETLYLETRQKKLFLFRTNSGELALVEIRKLKKQSVVRIRYANRDYWFLKKKL